MRSVHLDFALPYIHGYVPFVRALSGTENQGQCEALDIAGPGFGEKLSILLAISNNGIPQEIMEL